MPWLNSAGQG